MNRPITSLAFVAVLAMLSSPGCRQDVPQDGQQANELARLTRAVENLTASNEALGSEVRRQARQLATLSREQAADAAAGASDTGAAPSDPTAVPTDVAAAADAAPAASDVPDPLSVAAIDALVKTEAGKQAIQEATARELDERAAKDRRLFVSYQVGMFAQKAGLDERQTEALQSIWKTSMDGGVELRKQFKAVAKLPEAEQEEARGRAMESMRGLGRTRRESVREVLDGEQLEMYEKAEEEIVAGLHGAPRR